MDDINGKILGVVDRADSIWASLQGLNQPFAVVDIVIVGALLYFIYLFLRQTRALGILYGIVVLAVLWLLGQALQLVLLNTILRWLFTSILIAIPVVFQPELRTALERLGRTTKFVTEFSRLSKSDIERIVGEILKAVAILSTNNYGALIVIGRSSGLKEYALTGQLLYANVNSKLLANIFTPKAPLHDGAVIISGNKIVAASATLPISEDVVDLSLGTRHKAALSLSGETDAICLIVSEESGAVSLAVGGRLQRNLNQDELESRLVRLLSSSKLLNSAKKKNEN